MHPWQAFVVALVAIVVGAAIVLTESSPRRAGTNNLPPAEDVVKLAPGDQACQPANVPPDTASVLAYSGGPAPGAARVGVELTAAGRRGGAPAHGVVQARADGALELELSPRPAAGPSEICLANVGRDDAWLKGFPTLDGSERARALRSGELAGIVALDFYRPGTETALSLAPVLAERFGFGKAGILGPWSFWAAFAAVVAAWAAAALALRRGEQGP